jgi:hypothetical protein
MSDRASVVTVAVGLLSRGRFLVRVPDYSDVLVIFIM